MTYYNELAADNIDGFSDIDELPESYTQTAAVQVEVDTKLDTINQATVFSDTLKHTGAVRKADIVTLESIVGELTTLPHLNSYTNDYSLVNFTVSQEGVLQFIGKTVKQLAKLLYDLILKSYKFLADHFKSLYDPKAPINDRHKTEDIKKHTEATSKKAEQSADNTTKRISLAHPNADDDADSKAEAKRIVRINKDLRSLLYPTFNELGVLSMGGDINAEALFDEMCEQRMQPFYTTFVKALHEKDNVLLDFCKMLSDLVETNYMPLSDKANALYSSDMSVPLTTPVPRMFTKAPPALIEFLTKYDTKPRVLKGSENEFYAYMVLAIETMREITSINITHPLPSKRTITEIDYAWVSDMIPKRIVPVNLSIDAKFKKARNNFNDVDVTYQESLTNLHKDWVVINDAISILQIVFKRSNALMINHKKLLVLMDKALIIIDK